MKVIYENGEKEKIINIARDLREKGLIKDRGLFSDDFEKEYSINFRVTCPEIAEYILVSLLNNKLEDFDIGIDITSINMKPYKDKNIIKQELFEAIDKVFGEV